MKTRTKVVFLELVAGIFGWMWLAAGAATFYFIITAIWFNGSWSMILVAIAISIICKWLAKGFHDNKIRVAYEAELISQGMTAEEAGKSWVRAYLGKNQNTTRNKDEEDSEIIRNYAMFIEKNPIIDEIKDRTHLPHTRDQILDALVSAFEKTNDANQKEQIKALATTLAHFQPNVGKEPLTLLGARFSNFLNDENMDIDKIADSLSAENFSTARYNEFYTKVQNDAKKIMARFNK
jgi:uncharacterized protein YpuA (DUF1002 family)